MRLGIKELIVFALGAIILSLGLTWLFASVVDNNLVMTQRDLATARQTLATTRDQITAAQSELQHQQADAQYQMAAARSQLAALQAQIERAQQILSTTPTIIFLDNKSMGTTIFYADGRKICLNQCVIAIRGGTNVHDLQALTYYEGLARPYSTPTVSSFQPGAILQYVSCGQTGTLGSNCGLFDASRGR